jgi:hypothetical protein
MTLPTVAEYFAQYAEKGHIFPAPGLTVRLRHGSEDDVMMIAPAYSDSTLRIYNDYGYKRWDIQGNAFTFEVNDWILDLEPNYDITAILDESGNVVAGEG